MAITQRENSIVSRLEAAPQMRKFRFTVTVQLALVTLGACAGNVEKPTTPARISENAPATALVAEKKKDTSRCLKTNRNGNYRVQLQGLSSSCSRISDYDEQLKDGIASLGLDCAFDKPDKWSEDGCTLERAYTCKADGGGSTRTIQVSSQNADDASILVGILSIRQLDRSGSESCQGTFRFIASRQ